MKKTYHGSCRCKKIQYEVDLDLAEGTGKCNCTYCWKLRWWGAKAQPNAFRLISGQEATGYGFPTDKFITRALCVDCAVISFGWGNIPQVGGDFVSINLACLDDLDPAELIAAPVTYMDGRTTTGGIRRPRRATSDYLFSPVSGTAYFCSSGNCAAAKTIVSGRKPNTLKLTHWSVDEVAPDDLVEHRHHQEEHAPAQRELAPAFVGEVEHESNTMPSSGFLKARPPSSVTANRR